MQEELAQPASILERLMMSLGRNISKRRFVVGPAVLALLIFCEAGWYRCEMTKLPFERLWSPRSGRLAKEWDYYEDYVVKPARDHNHRITYVDKRVMGSGSPMTGAGGNVLSSAALDEHVRVHEIFYDTNVTTSAGNTYFGRDLCERPGTDAPGPIVADESAAWTDAERALRALDGVGKTQAAGAWQDAAGLPGYIAADGIVTDQHRANSYFAFHGLSCPALLGGTQEEQIAALGKWHEKVLYFPMSPAELQADTAVMGQLMATTNCSLTCIGTADVTDTNYQAFAAAFQAELLTNPAHLVAYSYDQVLGAGAAATAHLAASGIGGTPLMSQATLCSGLLFGGEMAGLTVANALPAAQLPCQILSVTDCFANPKPLHDPVYANFLDPLLPGRAAGADMPAVLQSTALGPAEPAGFSTKPSWTGKTEAQLGAIVSELKWSRYANRTEIRPDALHSMAWLAASGLPGAERFAQPLASAAWANCSAGRVAVYKRAACSPNFDVDGCRVRVAADTNFTAEGAALAGGDVDGFYARFAARVLDKSTSAGTSTVGALVGAYDLANATGKAQLVSEMQRCSLGDAAPCTGVLPPHDPLNGVVDAYVLTELFLDAVAEYECVEPSPPVPAQQGCQYFATVAQWSTFQMFGDTVAYTDASNATIAEAPYSFEQYFMASPLSVVARRATTHPGTTLDDAEEAAELFGTELNRRLLELRETTSATFVAMGTKGYFTRMTHEAEEVPWRLIAFGLGLCALLIPLAFTRPGKPLHSRVGLLARCQLVVGLSLSAAMGLFSWAGLEFNQTMTAVIPFLGIAIGIDDCFILVRYFDQLGVQRIMNMELDEIVAHTLKNGGASVTLTSWCNVCAFALGYMIDVPGLADFCLGAAIVAAVDWLCMMSLVPLLIRAEAQRIKARRGDLLPCLKDTRPESLLPPTNTWETLLTNFAALKFVPLLGKRPVALLVALLSCTGFACSVAFTEGHKLMPLGFLPQDLARDGSPTQYFLQTLAAHYDAYPLSFFLKDLDYPNQQRELVELFSELQALEAIERYPVPSWLTQFATFVHMASSGALGLRNTDTYDANCMYAGAEAPTPGCTPGCSAGAVPNFESLTVPYEVPDAGMCVDVPNPFYCPMDTSYTHAELLPYGMVNAKCFYAILSLFTSPTLTAGITLPFFPAAGDAAAVPNPLAALGDQMGAATFRKRDNTTRFFFTAGVVYSSGAEYSSGAYACPGYDPADAASTMAPGCINALQSPAHDGAVDNPLILTEWTLYMSGMRGANGNEVQVRNMNAVRATIAASPLADHVFPQNEAFTYGEVNHELYAVFARAFAIDIGVICLIAIALLQSLTAGVMTAAATAFIVYELYLALSGLVHFNIISAACLLMSVGIAVEFTAHLVSCYTMETAQLQGAVAKMQHAMRVVAPPLLLGTLSTFLGNLPLMMHFTRFVKLYFFQSFALVVAIGLANALLFLPAKLMVMTMAADALAALGCGAARPGGKRAEKGAGKGTECTVGGGAQKPAECESPAPQESSLKHSQHNCV